jgi:hypothetical protein
MDSQLGRMSVPAQLVLSLLVALQPKAPWADTYGRTAQAIAHVAESDPLFEDHGEERTAALLVAIAWHESRFKPDAKSANGRYVCLYQIDRRHLPDPTKALSDPEVCTRAALAIVKDSLAKCAKHPLADRLAVFMSGSCDKGIQPSRYRSLLAARLLREHPAPPPERVETPRGAHLLVTR